MNADRIREGAIRNTAVGWRPTERGMGSGLSSQSRPAGSPLLGRPLFPHLHSLYYY
ncbi:MAG: hypothetical protein ACREKK_00470 [Candidatus Methylomirabilales bacterium]